MSLVLFEGRSDPSSLLDSSIRRIIIPWISALLRGRLAMVACLDMRIGCCDNPLLHLLVVLPSASALYGSQSAI